MCVCVCACVCVCVCEYAFGKPSPGARTVGTSPPFRLLLIVTYRYLSLLTVTYQTLVWDALAAAHSLMLESGGGEDELCWSMNLLQSMVWGGEFRY